MNAIIGAFRIAGYIKNKKKNTHSQTRMAFFFCLLKFTVHSANVFQFN